MSEREKGGKTGKKEYGRARERACSEEVVEVLEKRGEEKDERRRADNGRAVTENEEHNKRTRGQMYKRINYNPRRCNPDALHYVTFHCGGTRRV